MKKTISDCKIYFKVKDNRGNDSIFFWCKRISSKKYQDIVIYNKFGCQKLPDNGVFIHNNDELSLRLDIIFETDDIGIVLLDLLECKMAL